MNGSVYLDLQTSNKRTHDECCDVCVIGAGAAGVYLAVQLTSRGLDVILIEAGGSIGSDAAQVGFDAQFADEFYPGATDGRAFGLGGSTSRWGGLLAPHTQHDLREACDADIDSWSHIIRTVSDKSDHVLKVLGYPEHGDFFEFAQVHLGSTYGVLSASGLDAAAALILPFRSKNLAFLLERKASNGLRPRIFTNAVAKSWIIEQGAGSSAQLRQLTAVAQNGNKLRVTANRFVVAAGTIESARILLELDSCASCPAVRPTAAVGCYLADHLSVTIADVADSSLKDVAEVFAPRFISGWMRSFRFMESNPPANAPRAYAHFIFDNNNPGFVLARQVLKAIQARRWPKISFAETISGINGLFALVFARYVHSVLHISPGVKTYLQLDVEQTPVRHNRIFLDAARDRYGRQQAVIQWRISDIDLENLHTTADRILQKWPGGKGGLPELVRRNPRCDSTEPHDVYHPVGVCRMGSDPEAVVDRNLKVWGAANLWVASTAVLPSAGTANPTFTMLCLVEALAEHLSRFV